jgi:NAD(P) transhydrogenase
MANAPLLKNDGLASGSLGNGNLVIGVLKEPSDDERRVSMVPQVITGMKKDGYTFLVQSKAGLAAGFPDAEYVAAGAKVVSRKEVIAGASVLTSINPPVADFGQMSGKGCISWCSRMLPASASTLEKARTAGVTLIDTTAVPRITIAQKLDVLSSQAKVAGHRAVLEAAYAFERFHSGEITAAGKYNPSKTFVLGCGVAGLAAIGTSRALGSVVRAWDVRDVSDQVISMGGSWVTVDFKEDATGQGGYAKESSQEFLQAQHATFAKNLKEVDIVITTAAIPGRPSPRLIEEYMVKGMKPGSVLVDLAATGGGNCAATRKGVKYVTDNGVTVIGYEDFPARMASQASAMYSNNMMNLFNHVGGKDKAAGFTPNLSAALAAGESGDIIARSIVCCKDGQALVMPKPPAPPAPKPKEEKKKKAAVVADPWKDAVAKSMSVVFLVLLLLGMGEGITPSLLTTFMLAGAAGYQAVWGVAHALHTPLMAVTNAISGLTAIGGLLLMDKSASPLASGMAYVATAVSAVNVFGGFIVSQRMLDLFKRPGDADFSYLMAAPAAVLAAGSFMPGLEKPLNAITALFCIMSIGGLASMKSSQFGAKFGMAGVFGGIFSTLVHLKHLDVLPVALVTLAIGGAVGSKVGSTVSPIALPQTVAGFHSLVGFAAMTTSIASYIATPEPGVSTENIASQFGNFIGGITLTGSIVAYLKLNGNMSSKALDLPGKNYINICGLLLFFFFSWSFMCDGPLGGGQTELWATAVLAAFMGYHLVGSVGGGDMPVCITVLNSYSGWALVAEGFLLKSTMLTIVGSLIGFSGAILTKIMCDAMNRDIFNVIFGGMNTVTVAKEKGEAKPHTETNTDAVAELLAGAKNVLIVPGYGMAVSRAQGAVGEIAATLQGNGIACKFGIHPVAGRMPGQMNVLLAEASVPYDYVHEMDEVNPDMESFDVCLVIGANDITNSAANDVEGCPIYGMPVIEVWRSKKVIFFKRSMAAGYADLENPVFFLEQTDMLLGDAKKSCDAIGGKLKQSIEDMKV